MDEWLTAPEAQARLGVRAQTLYAYVSRGRIQARPDPGDPRRSLYRAEDVAGLETRKARGRKVARVAQDAIAWGEPVLASAITTIAHGQLYYRGRDVAVLARTETFESVARLLRGGDGFAFKARAPTPASASPNARARAFAFLAQRAATDAPARGRTGPTLAAEAAGLLDGLTDATAGRAGDGAIHVRLAAAWGCDAAGGDLIRMALVLLADHELNASTFAARVAASTGASLAASALAGLATLSGPLHGGMAPRVQAFLAEAGRVGPVAAVHARRAQGLPLPGFGHPLYPSGDPRARALLAAFTVPADIEAVRVAGEAVTGAAANVDFALTALMARLGGEEDAPFLLFALGRCAGWLAHALEQTREGQLIRPRARYVGPAPG